jgi:uncharacterized protein with PIN domain
MNSCYIRYYGNLKELVKPSLRQGYELEFTFSPGIRDVIEADGIPHTEIGLIIVNGSSEGWKYRLKMGDSCAVYPFFRDIDISEDSRVIEKGYPEGRFILDVHLGKLCRYLRMIGFDSSFDPGWSDAAMIGISNSESRIILTMDRGLLKNGASRYGCLVRSSDPVQQLRQVADRYSLAGLMRPMTRCLKCNGIIQEVSPASVYGSLKENTKKFYLNFYRCLSCNTIYWKGTHYENMKIMIERLFAVII